MKSILDPTFSYTPSTRTDISRTFDRIRREQHGKPGSVAEDDGNDASAIAPIAPIAPSRPGSAT